MFTKTRTLMAAATAAKVNALLALREALMQQVADVDARIELTRIEGDDAINALIAIDERVTPPQHPTQEEARAKLKAMAEGKDIAAGTQPAKQADGSAIDKLRRAADGRPIMGDLEQRLADALGAERKPDAAAPAGV